MLLLLALGCVDGSTETADTAAAMCEAAPDLTWSNWGDGFFANYCRACHSANVEDRWGAPADINFDTFEEVQQSRGWVHYEVIVAQTMPVGGGVYDEDLEALAIFLECGL